MFDFVIQNEDGTTVFFPPFESISIKEELNKGYGGSLRVSYPDIKKYAGEFGLDPDDIFATAGREWYVRKNEVKIFGGIILDRTINGGASGMTSYSVNIGDFSNLLAKRRTALFWQRLSTDSATIVSDLLDYTNALDDTGISIGTTSTTKDRDLTSRRARIRDEIVSMSNLKKKDGYDWDVDVIKNLNLNFPSKGSTKEGIVFDEFNTTSFQSKRQLQGKLTNKAYVLGKGYQDDMVTADRENTASQSTWGLLEDVVNEKGVGTVSELEDRGDQFLADNAFPDDVLSLKHRDGTPDVTSYNVGDTVRLRFSEIDLDDLFRIYKRNVRIDDSGGATVDLAFE